MKFIIITGPQAVGKMTVGQELVKITNLKLLHNHMTIEVLTKIFDYSRDSFRKLNEEFRIQIFEELQNFTFMLNFSEIIGKMFSSLTGEWLWKSLKFRF